MRGYGPWLILGATLALVGSCSSSKSKDNDEPNAPETEATETPDDDAEHTPPPARAAPRADELPVMALAVWPTRWAAVDATVSSLAKNVPPVTEALEEGQLTSAWSIVALLFRAVDWGQMAEPPDGLNDDEALVLEVFPSPARFEEVALEGLRAKPGEALDVAMWPRIRVTLPARDAEAMAATVIERAGAASLAEIDAGRVYGSESLLVRVSRVSGAVVLDVVNGSDLDDLDAPRRDALLGPAPSSVPPPAFARPRSSALRMIVCADGAGDLGAISGMIKTAGALRGAQAAMHDALLLEGTSEVMVAYLLMDPATSIADAALVDVPADTEQSMQLALALSEPGRTVFDAAGLGDGTSAELAALDWNAALAKAPITPILDAVERPADLAELFHECGWSCWQYVLLGNAVQLARALGGTGAFGELVAGLPDDATPVTEALRGATLARSGRFVIAGGGDAEGLEFPAGDRPSGAAAEAAACYRKALVAVRAAFGAVGRADASRKRVALHEGKVELDGAAACANADPASAARYATMKALVDEVVTKAGLDAPEP